MTPLDANKGRDARRAARLLARTLQITLSDNERADIVRLAEHKIAAPDARERRYRQLGLILRLYAQTGERPNTTRYDQAHQEATTRGETWPDRATLTHHYKTFEQACEAAERFLLEGSGSRVPDSYEHATRRSENGTYTESGKPVPNLPHLVARALIAFLDENGDWPIDPWEYDEWAALRRKHARTTGQPPPPLPNSRKILKAFPDLDEAIAFAQTMRDASEPA